MITLDKIKLVSALDSVSIVKAGAFEKIVKQGVAMSESFTQISPYRLYVKKDYENGETVIEFTGKILMDMYPELINRENFRHCLECINRLGVCEIDMDSVIRDGRVCVADVTRDVLCIDPSGLSEWVRTNISNHRKYLVRNIGGNLVVEKNVKTKGYKRRLTIYDKGKELNRADNHDFIFSLADPDKVLSYFDGRVRFEFNLNSKAAIRQSLGIADTSVAEVLNSEANPIRDFVDDIISDVSENPVCNSLKDRKNLAFLRDCDMDMCKVEAEIRKYCSKKSKPSQLMEPFRELWNRLNSTKDSAHSKGELLNMLLEIAILFPLLVWA